MEVRTCPICRADKPLTEYYLRHKRLARDGGPSYQHGCKVCRRLMTKAWQDANPERKKAIARRSTRAYYRVHKDAIKARKKAAHALNPEPQRAIWRERNRRRKLKLAGIQPEAAQ